MEYWLLFWAAAADVDATDAEVAARLRRGEWECVRASPALAEFRRDLLASDPDWTAMTLQPRPGSGQPADRYLALGFTTPPTEDEVRDLRYVAARNRLRMFDPRGS